MELDVFWSALGYFPVEKAGDPIEALVSLWNGEMKWLTQWLILQLVSCPLLATQLTQSRGD